MSYEPPLYPEQGDNAVYLCSCGYEEKEDVRTTEDEMNELKQMFPPDTPIKLRKHTIERLDKIAGDLIRSELLFRDDVVDFLISFYEAQERVRGESNG